MQVQIMGYLIRELRKMKINFNRFFAANLFNFPEPFLRLISI